MGPKSNRQAASKRNRIGGKSEGKSEEAPAAKTEEAKAPAAEAKTYASIYKTCMLTSEEGGIGPRTGLPFTLCVRHGQCHLMTEDNTLGQRASSKHTHIYDLYGVHRSDIDVIRQCTHVYRQLVQYHTHAQQ
jgi:hypothetical protein